MVMSRFTGCLVFTFCVLSMLPVASAQTTSVTILTAPSQVQLESDGSAHFDVTAQVTYTGYSQANNLLSVVVMYHGTFNPLVGSGSSTPDSCNPSLVQQGFVGYTLCFMKPSSSSGIETVTFTFTISNAQPQQYHFDVNAGLVAVSSGGNSEVGGSLSSADFYVTVQNQPTQVAVTQAVSTPTSSLQMPQPPQSINSQPTIDPLVVLAVVATIAIATGVVLVYLRRGKQAKSMQAKKTESKTQQLTSSRSFCIECGTELTAGSKFCNKCGSKQE